LIKLFDIDQSNLSKMGVLLVFKFLAAKTKEIPETNSRRNIFIFR